jgi:membrane protein
MTSKSGQEMGRNAVLTHGVVSKDPNDLLHGTGWRVPWAVVREASLRLWSDDAFGLAGNVAFRALLAIFPFLIFTSSLTAFIGDRSMAEDLIDFLIAIIPPPLVEPIVSEVERVMTVQRGGVLSVGILLTIWFAMGGVDGIRVGINRAYGIHETRSAVVLNLLQIAMVLLASFVLVIIGYLLVLAPRAGSWLHDLMPDFDPASVTISLIRYPTVAVILILALFSVHVILPARRTRFENIWPGVLFTAVVWMLLAAAFSLYLRRFANYGSYYAGLAGIVAALYFMYLSALVLIFGGELNRAMRIRRLARALGEEERRRQEARESDDVAPAGSWRPDQRDDERRRDRQEQVQR